MANELYQLKVGGTNGRGNYAECDLNFACDNTSGDGPWDEAKAILNWFVATCMASLKSCLGNDCKIDVLHCRRVETGGGTTAINVVAEAGTAAFGTFSEAIAVPIQLVMNTVPRPGHIYLWGVPIGAVIADHLDTVTYVPNLTTLMGLLVAGGALGNGDTVELAVWHRATHTYTHPVHYNILDKVTAMNRRTRPLV